MSIGVTVHVSGLEGIRQALNSVIPAHFQGAALQKALAAAAKPIIADAKARAPVLTGTLRGDIYSFKDLTSSPTHEIRGISVRTGKRATKKQGDAFYWVWIEYGHGEITTTTFKSLGTPAKGFFGTTVKAYPAHPFMRPAYEAQKQAALQVFEDAMRKQITAAADKAGY
jgi:HK97 gp10 family phage protein